MLCWDAGSKQRSGEATEVRVRTARWGHVKRSRRGARAVVPTRAEGKGGKYGAGRDRGSRARGWQGTEVGLEGGK